MFFVKKNVSIWRNIFSALTFCSVYGIEEISFLRNKDMFFRYSERKECNENTDAARKSEKTRQYRYCA